MLRITAVLLLPLAIQPAWATITAVHLGPNGAEITREMPVSDGQVALQGLPPALDVSQLRITPGDGLRIEALDLRTDFDAQAQKGRRSELEQALHDVEDQLALLARETQDRTLARELLGRVGSGEQGITDVKQTVTQVRDALYRLAQQEIEARSKRRELEQERESLRAELKSLGQRSARTQGLYLDVAGGEGSVRVQYPVQNARFEVRYRLRLDSAEQAVILEPRLLVSQNTGSDWKQVRLTASTTKPSYRLDVPQPTVQVLRPRPPKQEEARRKRSEMMAFADRAPGAQGASMPSAKAQANTYDIRLEVPGRVDIPADNRPRPFAMPSLSLEADVHARIVPQRDAAAYVHAEWTMPASDSLVAGMAEVLRDQAVVGRTRLPQLLPGQTHAQGFGIDPALDVTVERDPIQRDESFFGGKQRWLRVQSVRVESAHSKAMAVRMIDSVPVPGDDAISVELAGDEPSQRNVEDRKGVHAWTATLAPGGNKRWETRVTISAPADMDLGL